MPAGYDLGTARGTIEVGYDGRGIEQAQQGLDNVKSKSGKTQQSLDKAARGMGLAGLAIAGGIGLAVKSASNFETVISGIAAVTGASGNDLDKLRGKALQLGKDTQYSASQAAQAIEELAKAGVGVPDILNGAADAAVSLAAAGGIALPEAATQASNAMNAFSLEASKMPHVADVIAGAANSSAIDVHDFGLSLSQSGAAAHLAGLNFDDLAVAIAEMGQAGIKGSDAGTSIKSLLLNLIPQTQQQTSLMMQLGLMSVDTGTAMQKLAKEGIKPASTSFNDIISAIAKYNEAQGGAKANTTKARKEALKQAQAMGVVNNQFFDAKGNLKNLRDIQALLADSTKNLTKEQKLSAFQTLFGSDAIRSASILTEAGAKGYDKYNKAIQGTKAADVAKKRMDNLHGSLEQLKGSVETLAIGLGEILLPIFKKIVDVVTSVVNTFIGLPKGVQKAILVFLGVIATALLLSATFIKVAKGIQAFKDAIGVFKQMKTLMSIGSKLTNPWALAIMAIVLVIILLVKYHKQIWAVVQQVWGAIASFLDTIWSAIKTAASAAWGAIKWYVTTYINIIKKVITTVFGAIKAIVLGAWTGIKWVVTTYINIIKTVITTVLGAIKGVWSAVWGAIKGFFSGIWDGIVGVVRAAIYITKKTISDEINAIKNIWNTVWGGIKSAFSVVWDGIKTIVKNAIKILMKVIQPFIDAFNTVKDGAGWVIDKVGGAIGAVNPFARGGLVPGKGNKDTVPAILTPGEFVLTKQAVQRVGLNNLAALNGGARIMPAAQGLSDVAASARPSAPAASGAQINMNIYNPISETASDTGARRLRSLAALGVI